MSNSLLESLDSLVTPGLLGPLAGRLGESPSAVAKGVRASGTSILAGLAGQLRDSGSMRQIFDLLGSGANDGRALADVAGHFGAQPSGALGDLGGKFLASLFGGRSGAIGDLIAKSAGLKPGTAGRLLALVAPLVMGLLGRRIREGGLDVGGLTALIAGQKEEFLRAAPAGLGSLLGFSEIPRVASSATAGSGAPTGRRWLWPALAAAAVVALLFYFGRNPRAPEAISSTMGDDAVGAMSEAAARAATATGAAASHLGASVRRRLADGIELLVPERGIESQVVAFLDDPNRPVDRTTWFNFDRLTFETGSATIRRESAEQLDNIAAILRAYPAARIKVGGYTDNTGDRAANQRLSQARADAVRDALLAKEIAGDRVEAEGYGDQYPVGDNATEAGRERNRRIALRVTAK